MTRFKELCLDTARWRTRAGPVLGGRDGVHVRRGHVPGDPGDVVGDDEGMGIALCPVPEGKTVKHRVHLDVHTDSVDSLLALGATPAPGYDAATRGRSCSTPRATSCVRSCATASCRRTAPTS